MMPMRQLNERKSDPARWPQWTALLWLAIWSLGGAGCQSTNNPAPDALASVTITNRTPAEIAAATQSVFARNGFEGGAAGPNQFRFQRPGSRMDNLAYGGVLGGKITVEASVSMRELTAGTMLLVCTARLVADAGEPVFQEDHKVRRLDRESYQKMLNEIQAQLK
jgi:hypothetical protein